MTSLPLILFIFLIQLIEVQGERYDIDDPEGIIVIVLLVVAGLVCLVVTVMFAYIVYKLWNGDFRRNYYVRSISREKITSNIQDEQDGSRYSTFTTEPMYSSVNKTAVAEDVVKEENDTAIVETRVDEQELTTEEVIVTQAPSTDQAEMETQELVIVFDNNDDVVDVFTHVT